MKTLNLPKEYFIGSYFIDERICDNMISFFWANKHSQHETKMPNEIKKCTEMGINANMNVFEPYNSYLKSLNECLKIYQNDYGLSYVKPLKMDESFNIQHYKPGEGFYSWHYERDSKRYATRHLVFMTYLNDVDDGGTEFLHQNIEIKARKGLTLIWPTDFTHTHRGVISKTKEKTIITGWFHLDE